MRRDAAGRCAPPGRTVMPTSSVTQTSISRLTCVRSCHWAQRWCPAVDWVEDPDSRVEIVPTALGDLRGVARLLMHPPIARFLGITRYVALRSLVFARSRKRPRTLQPAVPTD